MCMLTSSPSGVDSFESVICRKRSILHELCSDAAPSYPCGRSITRPLDVIHFAGMDSHLEEFGEHNTFNQITFAAGDVCVDQDLRAVEEVAELSFPDDEVVGVVDGHSVLKAKHSFFRQNAVGYLVLSAKAALHSVQRHEYFIRLLINKHRVPLCKSSSSHVFA